MNIKKGKKIRIFGIAVFSFLALLTVFLTVVFYYVRGGVDFSVDESLFIKSKGGNITRFYYDGSYGKCEYAPIELCSLEPQENKKQWYSYDDIGDNVKNAFLAVEDRRFYKHKGVDIKRTGFAFVNYFLHIKPKFGGSTITQQVIKNISGDDEQTVTRKLTEMIRASHIEKTHSKEEIFELYLNIVPMGEGILGVGLASEYYFGKNPDSLTVAEAATLVGITNAPTRYNPHTRPEACIEKRNRVLYSMFDFGVIDENEYIEALNSPLIVTQKSDTDLINSWFVETVCDDVARDLSERFEMSENAARFLIMNGGLSVYTTVNPEIQGILEKYFENESNLPEAVKNGLNYSMTVVDSHNGNLVGIIGGAGKKQGNRLLNYALVPQTPGSVLKPLALYAPLINSKRINWATVFDDAPVYFNKNNNGDYLPYPRNYPDKYYGLTTVSNALRDSKNTIAVRLYNLLDKKEIFNSLKNDFGFDTLVESKKTSNGKKITDIALSPLALGQLTYGVPLRTLTEAYTVFPSEGLVRSGRSYLMVYDSSGEVLIENKPEEKRVFSVECSRIMNKMLSEVTERGTAKQITLDSIVDTAGKTGTSGNDLDRFFIGYTPYYTAGIWCGYSDNQKSIGRQSISHIEIWDYVMKEIHETALKNTEITESFSVGGLEYLPYCKDSGKLFTERCLYDPRSSRLEYGYFTADNKPEGMCDRHIICLYGGTGEEITTKRNSKKGFGLLSLLDIPERNFPVEVYITDEEFNYKKLCS